MVSAYFFIGYADSYNTRTTASATALLTVTIMHITSEVIIPLQY
ncbi:hypothetical protein HMPREF1584_00879 [Gardnerella vaginalis JCP8481A]|nr:hypothetical protein HMPREF1584_00879 [Gardnerella vaginalis JCP8481A]EPI44337.1 hypothetical protein HMPREF1585_00131 [Gardnerella vaginalis JCP8481B]